MSANRIVIVLAALWAVPMALSFVHPWLVRPAGDGFVRGLDLVVYFFGWQALALLLAVAAVIVRIVRSGELTGRVRTFGYAPAIVMVLELIGVQTLAVFY